MSVRAFGRHVDRGMGCAYVVTFPTYDGIIYDMDSDEFYLDVTPEMRYAIWNKRTGRFSVGEPCKSELAAQECIKTHCEAYHISTSQFAVVPFEYPGEEK